MAVGREGGDGRARDNAIHTSSYLFHCLSFSLSFSLSLHACTIQGELRFGMGAKVECKMSPTQWIKGTVVGTNYREAGWPEEKPSIPYQVLIAQLDKPPEIEVCGGV